MCRNIYDQKRHSVYSQDVLTYLPGRKPYNSEMEEEEKTNKNICTKRSIESEDIRNDPFLKMAGKLTNASSKHQFHKEQMEESLKEGYAALEKKKYRQAIDCYKEALRISTITPLNVLNITSKDVAIIHFILNHAKVESHNYEKIVQAIKEMEGNLHLTAAVPAFSYLLGKAYYKLNRFKHALEPLKKCEEVLQNQFPFSSAIWPSTEKIIKETTREGLEESVAELINFCSTCPEKPTAVCRFDKCIEISTHIIPSDQIYISDPDFIGYISLTCDGKCSIQYHIQCWKAFKETFSSCEKVHDKDMLDRACPTTDCVTSIGEQSKICLIEIFGHDGKVKTQMKSEISSKQNIEKKIKDKKRKLSEKEDKPEKVVRSKPKPTKNKKMGKAKITNDNSACISSLTSISSGVQVASDQAEEMKKRLVVLEQLRAVNFGVALEDMWNYCAPYYGREDEKMKKEDKIFIPQELADEDSTRQYYKDFILSWFYEVISKNGPTKVDEIEEQWECTDEPDSLFNEVKNVLTDVSNVCDLLVESTRFCMLDDYICVSDHLPVAYNDSKTELTETVAFMLAEYRQQESVSEVNNEPSALSILSSSVEKKTTVVEGTNAASLEEDDNADMYMSDSDRDEVSDDKASDNNYDEDDTDCEEEESGSEVEEQEENGNEGETESCNNKDNISVKSIIRANSNDSVMAVAEKNIATSIHTDNITVEICDEVDNQLINNDTEHSKKVLKDFSVNTYSVDKIYMNYYNKSMLSVATQTYETYETYMETIQEYQNTQDSLKKDLDKLRKQATKSIQIIKKQEDDNQKLKEQKEKMILKYENEIAKKEATFNKEKEKLLAEKERATAQFEEVIKQLECLTKFIQNAEERCGVLDNKLTEFYKKNKSSIVELLEFLYKYFNEVFEINKNRITETLSQLHCLSKLDYLPYHSEVLKLTEKWIEFDEVQFNSRRQYELKYNKLKKTISSQVDIDVTSLFDDMMPSNLTEPEPSSFCIETIIKELINYNEYTECLRRTVVNVPNAGTLNTDFPVPVVDQNLIPSTSSFIKDPKTTFAKEGSGMSDSDLSNDDIKTSSSRAFEFLKNQNNEKSDGKKLKSSRDSAKTKNISVTDALEQALKTSIDSQQQAKKVKRGKTKMSLIQLQQTSSTIESSVPQPQAARVDSIWGDPISPQQLYSSVTNYNVGNSSPNFTAEEGDSSDGWKLVDKKSTRDQTSSVVPLLTPGHKDVKGHYARLIERLKKNFQNKTEKELSGAVKLVRERNNSSLTGLSMDEIESRVERLFLEKTSKKMVSMGMEKFGETAWGGGVVSSNTNWQCSSELMEECVICCDEMGTVNLTTLECHHVFHTECIRQWLKEKSVCPLCNKFTTMPDEFPAL